MTTAPTLDTAIKAYVAECEPHLADLEEADRRQLRTDIEEIVSEVCAELEGSPAQLIGPPPRFVAELRAAAGLQPPPTAEGDADAPLARRRIRDGLRSLWDHPASRWTRVLVPELRPAWFVGRGVLLAVVVARLAGSGRRPSLLAGVVPYWPVFGSELLGLGVMAAAVYLSVEAGRRSLAGWRRAARAAASLTAALMAFALAGDLREVADFGAREVVMIERPGPVRAPPAESMSLVVIGSDVTGRQETVVHLENARAVLDELLVDAPPAAIFIEHNGERVSPGTTEAIEAMLAGLVEEGLLNS